MLKSPKFREFCVHCLQISSVLTGLRVNYIFLDFVYFSCWISVEVTRISSLSVEVGEYIDVSEEQNLVNEAVSSAYLEISSTCLFK